MDKITELINKKDYYLVTEVTGFKTRLSNGVSKIEMAMYDNNDNLVASFEGDEHDDTVYDGLNEKLEKQALLERIAELEKRIEKLEKKNDK